MGKLTKIDKARMQDSAISLLERLKDNAPMKGPRGFGRNQTQAYYYKGLPEKEDYLFLSQNDPVAYRLVFEFTEAVWNNQFRVRFPTLNTEVALEKEEAIIKYLDKILFWENARLWNAFDRQQGESILLRHYEGDTDITLKDPAPENGNVIRVEAFNYVDYEIHQVKEYGDIQYVTVKIYKEHNVQKYIRIHPSRFMRMKLRRVDYDPYNGQPILRSIYSDIMILSHIMLAIGDAAFRWGMGIPAVYTKKITNDKERERLRNSLSKINSQAFLMIPEEIISKIEYLSNNMTNLSIEGLVKPLIDRIIIATGYPRNILMGEQMGVVRGGEVNQKEFMAIIDKEQTLLEYHVKRLFKEDPYLSTIVEDTIFDIDWGLRRVMTELDQAELNAKRYDNAIKLKKIGVPLNAILKEAKFPKFEELYKNTALIKKLFEYTPQEIGELPGLFAMDYVLGGIQIDNGEEEGDGNGNGNGNGNKNNKTGSSNTKNTTTKTTVIPTEKPTQPAPTPSKDSQVHKNLVNAIDRFRDEFGSMKKAATNLDTSKETLYKIFNAAKRGRDLY